jgi:hypothetical protein
MAGASWTNNLSWVEGYTNVLEPMHQLSAAFHQRFDPLLANDPAISQGQPYQEALLLLLLLETSCFRYWGQGVWTEYAREIHRRGEALIAQGRWGSDHARPAAEQPARSFPAPVPCPGGADPGG